MQLPELFVERTRKILGGEYADFEAALEQDAQVSLRINPRKADVVSRLKPVPWCERGFYLTQRPNFTFDPLFHAGAYYVQEASSMFLYNVLKQYVKEPSRYLDLCAAPGGKTTLAIDALPEGSLVVANEIDRKRCNVLAENLIKWGYPAVMVTNNDSSAFTALTHYFDVILTDVPCSGEGMFRKDAQAVNEWSVENVKKCVERQKMIIDNIWEALRPGGILVYSTCTYNIEENEQMIDYIRCTYGAESLSVNTDPEWGIHEALWGQVPVYRFMPHTTQGEGLFMAVLRKPLEDYAESRSSLVREAQKLQRAKLKKTDKKVVAAAFPRQLREWVRQPDEFEFEVCADKFLAYSRAYYEEIKMLCAFLNPVVDGLVLGSQKGKDVIPEHNLALSSALSEAFPRVDVELDQALSYLRRESLQLSSDVPVGYVILTYKGRNIGFVKNIGNRCNNLYPQEWRIRSGYTPQELSAPEI